MNVTLEIQDPLMVDLDVFYVTVLSDKVFDPGNTAPFLDEFAVGLEIEAGLE